MDQHVGMPNKLNEDINVIDDPIEYTRKEVKLNPRWEPSPITRMKRKNG